MRTNETQPNGEGQEPQTWENQRITPTTIYSGKGGSNDLGPAGRQQREPKRKPLTFHYHSHEEQDYGYDQAALVNNQTFDKVRVSITQPDNNSTKIGFLNGIHYELIFEVLS